MGKNYDAYEKATKAQDAARSRLAATNGGATQAAATEARNNALQADLVADEAWKRLMEDPQG